VVTDQAAERHSHRALTVKAFGITDKGRVRPTNEDQFLSAELTKTMRIWQTSLPEPKAQFGAERGHLFLVADGMGGHNAGEQASALAVAAIEHFTLNTFKWFFDTDGPEAQRVLTQFQTAIRQADARILQKATEHAEFGGMGTTVTMAFQLDTQLCVVHVGDSRAYLFGDDELHQITHDDTVTAEMVRRGDLLPEQAKKHRLRHVITNVVGGTEAVVSVEAHAVEVRPGDRLLLCSDGLTEMVPDARIAAVLREGQEPRRACERLVAEANERGGKDNITVVVACFGEA